nr:MFS transporter [Rhizobium paranaense]
MIAVLTGGMLLDGYILGVIGPVTTVMKQDMGMSTADMGLIASAALFGILIGSPLGGWAGDKFGRKPLFMIDMALFVLASAMQFFIDSVEMLFAVRLLMGVAIGAEYSVGWPQMSEFAPARLRGRLMGVTILAWCGGFMIGYTAGYILNLPTPLPWRFIIGTSTLIAVVLFVARLGLPESPRSLWSKGRKNEARVIARKYLESAGDMADMENEDTNVMSELHKGRSAGMTGAPWRYSPADDIGP